MKRRPHPPKFVIGWREVLSLPDLRLTDIPAKIDTGARTTALHAERIKLITVKGEDWVEFLPDHHAVDDVDVIARPLSHVRDITNTSGIPETRFVIRTPLIIGERRAMADISLTDRAGMKFPIIVGRRVLRTHRLIVDIAKSWTTGQDTRRVEPDISKDEEE